MKNSAQSSATQTPAPGVTKSFFVALALALAFGLGLVLGFMGRPVIIEDIPVQIVVTVVPISRSPVATPTATATKITGASSDLLSVTEVPTEPVPATPMTVQQITAGEPTPTLMDFVQSNTRHFHGDETAPVTIIEFSDFKCPFCARFASEALDQIRATYVDTGKVRFAYKHFAILGPESNRTAEASECAAEQGKFWAFHDIVFQDQHLNRSSLDQATLVSLAGDVDLDTDAFNDCLNSGRYAQQVRQESRAIQALGVRGTPGFLVNGLYIAGAQPFEIFQQIIEEQLDATALD